MHRGTGFRTRSPHVSPRPAKQYDGGPVTPRVAAPPSAGGPMARAPVPKGEPVRPGKRTPTAEERRWMDAIVAHGCIACRIDGFGHVPAAVHHLLSGGMRIGHLFTLPLCDPGHHQNGDQVGKVSRHPWKARFEARYGSEMDLLLQLRAAISPAPAAARERAEATA